MMLLNSDVPPLEDMLGLIDQVNKLREEVSPENSVVTSTKAEDTQAKKTPESLRKVMLNLHRYASTLAGGGCGEGWSTPQSFWWR